MAVRTSPTRRRRSRPIAAVLSLTLCLLAACGVLDGRQTMAPPPVTSTAVPPVSPTPTVATEATADPGPAPAFGDLDTALAEYASAVDGDATAIAGAIQAWGMEPYPSADLSAMAQPDIVVKADLTGDGRDEIIVLAANPEPETIHGEGTVAILSTDGNGYRVDFDSAASGDSEGMVALLSVSDADADGRVDVAYGSESCGAHTCATDVRVLAYHDGYVQLAQGIVPTYPDSLTLEDLDGDSMLEIVVHGNVYGSAGAGPQRASTLVYGLVEGRYRLTMVEYDPSDLMYFRVVDGNIALAQGMINEAIAIYTEVINNSELQPSGVFSSDNEEFAALRSFARFRLIVAYAMQEEPATGRELALIRSEAGPFLPAAEAFWSGYAESRSIEAGCTAVAELAEAKPEMLDILNSYGYANPYFAPEDLCRGTGSGLPEPLTVVVDPGSCAGCG